MAAPDIAQLICDPYGCSQKPVYNLILIMEDTGVNIAFKIKVYILRDSFSFPYQFFLACLHDIPLEKS
jgi:hypothetical protein